MSAANYSGWSTDELLQQLIFVMLGVKVASGNSTDALLQFLLAGVASGGIIDGTTGTPYRIVVNDGVIGIEAIT